MLSGTVARPRRAALLRTREPSRTPLPRPVRSVVRYAGPGPALHFSLPLSVPLELASVLNTVVLWLLVAGFVVIHRSCPTGPCRSCETGAGSGRYKPASFFIRIRPAPFKPLRRHVQHACKTLRMANPMATNPIQHVRFSVEWWWCLSVRLECTLARDRSAMGYQTGPWATGTAFRLLRGPRVQNWSPRASCTNRSDRTAHVDADPPQSSF